MESTRESPGLSYSVLPSPSLPNTINGSGDSPSPSLAPKSHKVPGLKVDAPELSLAHGSILDPLSPNMKQPDAMRGVSAPVTRVGSLSRVAGDHHTLNRTSSEKSHPVGHHGRSRSSTRTRSAEGSGPRFQQLLHEISEVYEDEVAGLRAEVNQLRFESGKRPLPSHDPHNVWGTAHHFGYHTGYQSHRNSFHHHGGYQSHRNSFHRDSHGHHNHMRIGRSPSGLDSHVHSISAFASRRHSMIRSSRASIDENSFHLHPGLILQPPGALMNALGTIGLPDSFEGKLERSGESTHNLDGSTELVRVTSGVSVGGAPSISNPSHGSEGEHMHQEASLESLPDAASHYPSRSTAPVEKMQDMQMTCQSVREFLIWEEWETYKGRKITERKSAAWNTQTKGLFQRSLTVMVGKGKLVEAPKIVCIVHPRSRMRLLWDLLVVCFLSYDVAMVPFQIAFAPHESRFDKAFVVVSLLFWTFDMVLSARTAYYDDGTLMLNSMKILRRYATSRMPCDALSVIAEWVSLVLKASTSGEQDVRVIRTLRVVRYLRFFRLLRLVRLRQFFQIVQVLINSEVASLVIDLMLFVMGLIVLCHMIACLWYGVGSLDDQSSWVQRHSVIKHPMEWRYLMSLHWALTLFVSSTDVYPENTSEFLVANVVLVIAVIAFSSLLAMLTGSVTQLCDLRTEQWRQRWILRQYLKEANISKATCVRVQRYLDQKAEKKASLVTEDRVYLLAELSEPLRDELRKESFLPFLSRHPVFDLHKEQTVVFIRSCLPVPLASGDLFFTCGKRADWACILVHGELRYWPGEEEGHNDHRRLPVSPGTWVTEAVLWTAWTHLGDLEAGTVCQLLTIESSSFRSLASADVELWDTLNMYARSFVQMLSRTPDQDMTDLFDDDQRRMLVGACFPDKDKTSTTTSKASVVSKRIKRLMSFMSYSSRQTF